MNPSTTDRETVLEVLEGTLEQLATGRGLERLAAAEEMPAREVRSELLERQADEVVAALQEARQWARAESTILELRSVAAPEAAARAVVPSEENLPYIPSNQTISLLQSAMDEYLEERPELAAAAVARFDTTDPGWLTVAWEKLKALVRGPHTFIKHTRPEDFRFDLQSDAKVALYSDWGTGEPAAVQVIQQIARLTPDHLIHLGDVYYSGTKREVTRRFLKILDEHGPDPERCRYWALNSNHEMYSGGYGYFELTLPAFEQPASYFNLGNADWRLIALDTGYEDHGLREPQIDWLDAQLIPRARAILLSHHQLFSAYDERPDGKLLATKMRTVVDAGRVFGWFWGHEHKAIVYGPHRGPKSRCVGHGAIPFRVPFPRPRPGVPVDRADERRHPDASNRGINGFAMLRFQGATLDVEYIDQFGETWHTEGWS
jgi:hypothetical protein